MSAETTNRSVDGEHLTPAGQEGEPYVRVHHILQIHHATAPGRDKVERLEEPETLDDCLVAAGANIAPYHFKAPFRWVNYHRLASVMEEARSSGPGKNHPYPRERVFAPVKVVLAEAVPIRAVLTFEPCYPWQAKLATRIPGQRLWLVYAAVAMLNSRFGEAYYNGLLGQTRLSSAAPHGLKIAALKQIPVARVDWDYQDLGKVVDLTHQLIALHEGREECLPLIHQARAQRPADYAPFDRQISAVNARLDAALPQLLGLGEAEEDALLRAGALPKRGEPAQAKLFEDWDLLPPVPPPPPVKLLGDSRELPPAGSKPGDGNPHSEIQRLLRFWEDVVNSRPPRELYEEAITERSAA